MSDPFIALHKAKHLLSHVLMAAGSRRWPEAMRGDSGETTTGFYADFGMAGLPDETELTALGDDMARVLRDFRSFHALQLTPMEALRALGTQPWKRHQIETIAEYDSHIQCYALDGFVDVCDCTIKTPAELRAVHPEKFLLTGAQPVLWSHRGRDEVFVRVSGELFPAPAPCLCCRAAREN